MKYVFPFSLHLQKLKKTIISQWKTCRCTAFWGEKARAQQRAHERLHWKSRVISCKRIQAITREIYIRTERAQPWLASKSNDHEPIMMGIVRCTPRARVWFLIIHFRKLLAFSGDLRWICGMQMFIKILDTVSLSKKRA